MTSKEEALAKIKARWEQVEQELKGIREGRVTQGPPDLVEQVLYAELDRLEYEASILEYPHLEMRITTTVKSTVGELDGIFGI